MISLNADSGELIWKNSVVAQLSVSEVLVLQYLMNHAGKLVTKEILLDIGWPGKVVLPNSLTVAIKNIRKALADISTSYYIETRHRKGYIFHIDNTALITNVGLSTDDISSDKPLPATQNVTKITAHDSNHFKTAFTFVINLIFYFIVGLLVLWSIFIANLDEPLICHDIKKAKICGYTVISNKDITYLEQSLGESEGTYLYGYDKKIDQIKIHKMD